MMGRRSGVPTTGITKEELDIQDSLEPELEYYDWKNTSAACISPVPNHPAYRSSFSDYLVQRSLYSESDTSDKTRLTFYLPRFPARLSADIASGYRISFSKFMTHIIELGLITMQIDYHEQYHIAKSARTSMLLSIDSKKTRNLYMQLDKMTISLGSTGGNARENSRHFSPAVPTWLYNAVNDVAVYLNMGKSDVVFLCWNVGMRYSVDDQYKGLQVKLDVDEFMENFEYELNNYSNFVKQTSVEISDTKNIFNKYV